MKPNSFAPHQVHDVVWVLLPWYVNETLEGAEHDLVREHLGVCITCRKELATQHRLATAIRSARVINISAQDSFSRLLQRIGQNAPATMPTRSVRDGLRHWWYRLRNRAIYPRFAAVPVAFALVMLIALAVPSAFWVERPTGDATIYHTLASPDKPIHAQAPMIHVVFAKSLRAADIAAVLGSAGGRIVDGPSPLGVYAVAVAADAESVAEVLTRLRSHAGVLFAEPTRAAQPKSPENRL